MSRTAPGGGGGTISRAISMLPVEEEEEEDGLGAAAQQGGGGAIASPKGRGGSLKEQAANGGHTGEEGDDADSFGAESTREKQPDDPEMIWREEELIKVRGSRKWKSPWRYLTGYGWRTDIEVRRPSAGSFFSFKNQPWCDDLRVVEILHTSLPLHVTRAPPESCFPWHVPPALPL